MRRQETMVGSFSLRLIVPAVIYFHIGQVIVAMRSTARLPCPPSPRAESSGVSDHSGREQWVVRRIKGVTTMRVICASSALGAEGLHIGGENAGRGCGCINSTTEWSFP